MNMIRGVILILFYLLVIDSISQVSGEFNELILLEGDSQYRTHAIEFHEPVHACRSYKWRLYDLRFRTSCKTIVLSDSSTLDSCFNRKGELESVTFKGNSWTSGLIFEHGKPVFVYQMCWLWDESSQKASEEAIGEWLWFKDGSLTRKMDYSEDGTILSDTRYDKFGVVMKTTFSIIDDGATPIERTYGHVTDYYQTGIVRRTYMTENEKLVDRMTFYDTLGVELCYIKCWQNQFLEYCEKGMEPVKANQMPGEFSFYYYNQQGDLVNKCTLKGNRVTFEPSSTEGIFLPGKK